MLVYFYALFCNIYQYCLFYKTGLMLLSIKLQCLPLLVKSSLEKYH